MVVGPLSEMFSVASDTSSIEAVERHSISYASSSRWGESSDKA